ncbi:hypothetical protein [Acinetobacter geminorum]
MPELEKIYKFSFCYKDHAKIDLNTLMISINSFGQEPHTEFFDAISKGDTSNFFISINQDFDRFKKYAFFESLILHEKTHYLDMTSTYYGLEYFVRKHNYHLVYGNKEHPAYANAREIFAVSLYELQPLESLKKILFKNWNEVKKYEFGLENHEKYGVYLKFLITSETGECNTFPLSMLMLLETRAFCIEYISLFEKSKYLNDLNKRAYETSLKVKFDQELNNCSMSEYNFLLKLAILEFDRVGIDFKKTIKFLSYLIGWTLNLSFVTISFMSSHIVKFFQPSSLRDALQMDMSRGMSRYILPFVIIQSIPIYYINNLSKSKFLKKYIENSPKEAINFLLRNFFDITNIFDNENLDGKLKLINFLEEKKPDTFISEILKRSYENSKLYEKNGYALNFLDYYFLADLKNVDNPSWGEWIQYLKLCNIDFEEVYFETNKNYELISMDKELYENYERIHMPIEQAKNTLDNLVLNPLARDDYIFKKC